jgi:hypothetical protein
MTEITPRHVRHRKRSRIRRGNGLKAFVAKLQATLNGTGATVTPFTATAASATLTKAAHGLVVGDGPYLATNAGGALPPGMPASFLWIASVLSANTFTVKSALQGAPLVFTGAGTGTNTLTKASTIAAVFLLLKKHGAAFMKHATTVNGI